MTSNQAPFPPTTRFFTVSTAGHVDHGKTSLIRALTGIDPDRLKEEKERQMTTDLGFAHMQLPGDVVVGFVDVPGHGKFLKNMLAGVGGIDLALLVVAADEGPMPQTQQHVRILSLLGVNKALVALTKIDTVSDPEHIALVKEEIDSLLNDHAVELVGLVEVSSTKSLGIEDLKRSLALHLASLPPREISGGAFLPVDRVFSKSGFGTVITGTLVRGKLAVGDQILVGPDVSPGRVRRLETFGHPVEVASAGQRLACNLVLKEPNTKLERGHVVLGLDVPSTKTLIVNVIDRPKIAGEKFADRISEQPVRIYHGTAEHHGYLRWAQALHGEIHDQESTAVALVVLNEPAMVQSQDRFILRLSDETIFGGEIVFRDRPRWLKRSDLVEITASIQLGNIEDAIRSFINAAPHHMVKRSQLSLFLPEPLAKETCDQLLRAGTLAAIGDAVMAAATRTDWSKRLRQSIEDVLKQHAGSSEYADGIALEAARSSLQPRLERALFQSLVDEEVAANRLVRKGDKLSLPGAVPQAAPAGRGPLGEKITKALDENFCLELAELAKICGTDVGKMKNAIQSMAKDGDVLLINYEFAISKQNLQRAHQVLANIWQTKRNIAPTDFREALNTSRKYAMALLQHFDDNKITRRLESGRVLLKAPQ
ncbi:MAG TPA: selenocysteine-specific translation elongation factor [Candidatus Obscuribacterales bacterium]